MNFEREELSLSELNLLNTAVRKLKGYDFNDYALSSFKRRVARFMSIERISNVEVLINSVVMNDKMFDRFLKEITVNTTEMFRFPSMWETLRTTVIPALKYKKHVRIWHVGCSSGEEVYSMAILLRELDLDTRVTMVATDINDEVLQTAKKGCYSSRNLETHQENYLKSGGASTLADFYELADDGAKFKMNEYLLDTVKFYKHNLIVDGDFGKFDLILCRNVLIYFNKNLQEQVFKVLLNSLNPLGFLVIGSKESLIWSGTSDRYKTISDKSKVFRLKESNDR